jgi:hypothetical protein
MRLLACSVQDTCARWGLSSRCLAAPFGAIPLNTIHPDPRLLSLYGTFDPNVPHGSPLSPMTDPQAPSISTLQGSFAPQAPQAPQLPQEAMQAPIAPLPQTMPAQAPATPQGLPKPPRASIDRKRYRPFDKANRQDALLAIGTGLLSHPESFAVGIGAAGENVGLLRKGYDAMQRQSVTTGGPDDAFQITVDPVTGQRTYEPIAPVQGYLKDKAAALHAPKAPDANDNVLMRGKTMAAIMRVPEAQRPAAYKALMADSKALGYDMGGLPDEYSPSIAQAFSDQTVTPVERMADERARATGERAVAAGVRSQANADRNYGLAKQRQGLAERKYASPPSTRKARPTQQALPSGAVLID